MVIVLVGKQNAIDSATFACDLGHKSAVWVNDDAAALFCQQVHIGGQKRGGKLQYPHSMWAKMSPTVFSALISLPDKVLPKLSSIMAIRDRAAMLSQDSTSSRTVSGASAPSCVSRASSMRASFSFSYILKLPF